MAIPRLIAEGYAKKHQKSGFQKYIDEANNPVTFGDNVRIDGRVYRGATIGYMAEDNLPFIIDDHMEITGSLNVPYGPVTSSDFYVNDTIYLTGNLRQEIDGEGALKAWAFIESDGISIGSVGWYYTASERISEGKYEVTLSIDISTVDSQSGVRHPSRPIIASPSGVDGNVDMAIIGAAPHATNSKKVLVWATDHAGNFADSAFTLAVY